MVSPEERPFIDAILAAPDDDAPRLVFADWLQARGDARGELISVQVALEDEALPWPERQRLEAKARALLREHNASWLAPLRDLREGHYTFKRGYAHHARFPGHQPLRLGELHERAPLLRDFHVLGALFSELNRADWVEGLQLEFGLFDLVEVMRQLELPGLRRLRLPWAQWDEPDDLARVGALDRPLEYLSLDFDQRTTPAHLEAFKSGLSTRTGLRSLRLEGARGIGVLPVQGLESLELVRCDVQRGDLLAMARDLVTLQLTENDLRHHHDPRVDVAELLEAAPKLKVLRLEGVALDDEALVRLSKSPHASRLKQLHLGRNRLTDYGAFALMGSGALDGLQYLNLDVNELSRKAQAALRKHFANAEVQAR